MQRTILHSDLNSFYASVEMMLNPQLRGKAVAVCGSTEERHGIVLAKSELAKKAGIKTGMVNGEAMQRCADLIIVPPHYGQYLKYSKLTREIYLRYTDQVEPYGMDECWLDVSGSLALYGSGRDIAEEIRQAVKEELGMTVSIGVSYNKVFAKLGSDMKKPDAITEISETTMETSVWPLPASDLFYCGPASARKLAAYGIHTIGDIAKTPPDFLKRRLGVNGIMLWQFANGLDTSRVASKDFVSPIKSIGHGITCTCDLVNEEEAWRVMLELSQDVGHKLRVHGLEASGVQITVKDESLLYKQYQAPLEMATQSPMEIARKARGLFQQRYHWAGRVRAITVRAINLLPKGLPQQFNLYVDIERRERRICLEDTVEAIRRRFGKRAIYSAVLMGDIKIPTNNSCEIIMPGINR